MEKCVEIRNDLYHRFAILHFSKCEFSTMQSRPPIHMTNALAMSSLVPTKQSLVYAMAMYRGLRPTNISRDKVLQGWLGDVPSCVPTPLAAIPRKYPKSLAKQCHHLLNHRQTRPERLEPIMETVQRQYGSKISFRGGYHSPKFGPGHNFESAFEPGLGLFVDAT